MPAIQRPLHAAHLHIPASACLSRSLSCGTQVYAGFLALLANLAVCVVATFVLRAMKAEPGEDRTQPDEYFADRDDPRVHDVPEVVH